MSPLRVPDRSCRKTHGPGLIVEGFSPEQRLASHHHSGERAHADGDIARAYRATETCVNQNDLVPPALLARRWKRFPTFDRGSETVYLLRISELLGNVASSNSLRCFVTACRVMSRCWQSCPSVCPLSARSRSSNSRRSGAASALNTVSTSAPIAFHIRQSIGCMSRNNMARRLIIGCKRVAQRAVRAEPQARGGEEKSSWGSVPLLG
jgi:hypothetical protein